MSTDFVDQDVIGYHREGIALEIVVMSIRGGKLIGQPRVLVHGPGVPRRRADLVVRRPLLRHGRVGARRGAAAHRDRGRGAEGGVADRAARAQRRGRASARSRCWCRSAATGASWSSSRSKNAAASFATRRNARADTELALGKLQKRLKLRAPAARDRVLRRLAHAGLRDGGVDGGVRRRPAGEGALPHVQGARARRGRRARAGTTTSRRCTRCCRGGFRARASRPTAASDDAAGSCPT